MLNVASVVTAETEGNELVSLSELAGNPGREMRVRSEVQRRAGVPLYRPEGRRGRSGPLWPSMAPTSRLTPFRPQEGDKEGERIGMPCWRHSRARGCTAARDKAGARVCTVSCRHRHGQSATRAAWFAFPMTRGTEKKKDRVTTLHYYYKHHTASKTSNRSKRPVQSFENFKCPQGVRCKEKGLPLPQWGWDFYWWCSTGM